jgi:outer membrane protein assembly factor BamB
MAPTSQLSISFEANQGQAANQVRFLARGPGYSFFLTPQEALLALAPGNPTSAVEGSPFSSALANPAALAPDGVSTLVGMQFLNANPQPAVTGEQPLPGIVNYFLGHNPARWHTNIPTYAQVRYHDIYPGIDLVYYGRQGHLEYDFIVAPGSDPAQIHLNFTGANRLSLDAQDELLLRLTAGDLAEGAPLVYQDINGTEQRVASHYVLQGATGVDFALGAYDHSQPLVIDPSVFFSTYLGGSGNDEVKSVAIDSSCSIYLTGATDSSDFPSQNPLQAASGGSEDAFVTKMSADGTTLLYSTYLGGSGADWGNGIAVDSAGNAYLTGVTFSTDFPTQNALQPAAGGGADDAFVTELNAAGNALAYSTYLGGGGLDWGADIAVDSAGNAYVTGGTSSGADSTASFPTHNALQSSIAGNANAFVAAISANGASWLYSTYLGGSNYDYGAGIVVDSAGNAYVTGSTHSSNFPTRNPLHAYGGAFDAFVSKLNTNGSALLYSTYLGGSGADFGFGIAVDSAGNAYVTGSTGSSNFPLDAPLQSSRAGGTDAFVTKINAAGSALLYSTYLGGANNDEASSIAVDNAGSAYITGSTSSTNFPLHSALQSTNAGGTDAFVARLNAAGNALLYSSYLGGANNDWGASIAVDGVGYTYIVGATASSNFPTHNSIQSYGGQEDGFLTKMNLMAPAQFQVSRGNIDLTTTPGVSPGPLTLTLGNPGDAPLNWTANSLPSWLSVSPSSGFLPAGQTQNLTLTFNTSGSTPQVYTTNLTLSDPNAGNSPLSIPVTIVAANVSKTWYFAEGYTGGSFSEYLTLANPNSVAATVQVTYLLGSGSPIVKTYHVGANARATITVNNEVGANRNVSMVVNADQPIVAERPMYFTFTGLPGYSIPGGSDVLGATSLATSFDFGYLDTTSGHATYLTILNQNSTALTATVHYFPAAGGAGKTVSHSVAAHSRGTVYVNGDVSAGSYSALVTLSQPGLVERPLYLRDSATGDTGAADVVGVATPQTLWDFAEGYTSSTFSERYILSNPGGSGTAHATVTFFRSNGSTASQTVTLAPGQQAVVSANSVLGSGNVNNSAQVTSDLPILAERFISFRYVGPAGGQSGNASIPGASDVLGATAPGNLFYFAEGYTGATFAEYLTIENPDPTNTATVQVTFLPSNGSAPIVKVYTIGHSSRFTLFTNSVMSNQSFSMVVESNVAIVAERPMYFIYSGGGQTGGSDVVGYQPAAPAVTPPPPPPPPPPPTSTIYTGSMDGYEYALNPTTGAFDWKYQTSGSVTTACFANGVVYFGSTDGYFYAVNAGNGTLVWRDNIGSTGYPASAVVNGIVYVMFLNGNLYALDSTTGSTIWSYNTGHQGTIPGAAPTVANGMVYISVWGQGITALNASTGAVVWTYSEGQTYDTTPAVDNGMVYFVSTGDSKVNALNATTGAFVWSYGSLGTTGVELNSPIAVNGVVYVVDLSAGTYAFNGTTGTRLWFTPIPPANNNITYIEAPSAAVANGIVYVGDFDGNLYAYSASDGSLIWHFKTGSEVLSVPTVANGVVYFGSTDAYIYALDASTGKFIWRYRTGSQVNTTPIVTP